MPSHFTTEFGCSENTGASKTARRTSIEFCGVPHAPLTMHIYVPVSAGSAFVIMNELEVAPAIVDPFFFQA